MHPGALHGFRRPARVVPGVTVREVGVHPFALHGLTLPAGVVPGTAPPGVSTPAREKEGGERRPGIVPYGNSPRPNPQIMNA
jgi:hypothetical protein